MELVRKDDVIEIINNIDDWYTNWRDYAIQDIKDLPTIEAKQGKWDKWYGVFKCSECSNFSALQHNYCPNCGAQMVEEE